MTIHNLKTWPEYYAPIAEGYKTFDLRRNDRNFKVGDKIVFEEFRPGVGAYTGRQLALRVNYILENFDGLLPGYCVLGIG